MLHCQASVSTTEGKEFEQELLNISEQILYWCQNFSFFSCTEKETMQKIPPNPNQHQPPNTEDIFHSHFRFQFHLKTGQILYNLFPMW